MYLPGGRSCSLPQLPLIGQPGEEFVDRLHDAKLAQAYSLLVPVRERPVGGRVKEFEHEDGSDLRTGVVGAAAGGEHDSEPDGVTNRVRQESRSGGSRRMGL